MRDLATNDNRKETRNFGITARNYGLISNRVFVLM